MSTSVAQRRQHFWFAFTSALVFGTLTLPIYGYLSLGQRRAVSQALVSPKSQISSTDPASIKVTVCELKENPEKYNHKLVEVSAFFSHGFENSTMFDPECKSRFSIWFEYGGKNATGTMYCCGLTSARTRLKNIKVEGFTIPLLVDAKFKTLDQLLHRPNSSIVHATVIGRFFSGVKGKAADGRDWWQGYGHMGCCSLLMIQKVLEVEPHQRSDLDYRAEADQPNIEKSGCGYEYLTDLDPFPSLIAAQKHADANGPSWMFDDPARVAAEALGRLTQTHPAAIHGLTLTKEDQGRRIYEWKVESEQATYMVVVSRPYALSFYSKSDRVAWVPIGIYRSSCGSGNSVRRIN